jgi:hypothetical protein
MSKVLRQGLNKAKMTVEGNPRKLTNISKSRELKLEAGMKSSTKRDLRKRNNIV